MVAVAGPPGSGTTTAALGVAKALGLELVSGGRVFRAMALEHGMSLAEFGAYAVARPAVDLELDRRLAGRARSGGVVIESRLAGWIVHNERLDGLCVCLQCDDRVRAERVAEREEIPVEQALSDNAEREKVEHDRYLALYGLDLGDLTIYDLVVDTGARDAEATTRLVVDAARDRFPQLPT